MAILTCVLRLSVITLLCYQSQDNKQLEKERVFSGFGSSLIGLNFEYCFLINTKVPIKLHNMDKNQAVI